MEAQESLDIAEPTSMSSIPVPGTRVPRRAEILAAIVTDATFEPWAYSERYVAGRGAE
jgi:hypothetical protein